MGVLGAGWSGMASWASILIAEVVAMIFAVQMSICFFISLSSFMWQSLHGHKDRPRRKSTEVMNALTSVAEGIRASTLNLYGLQ